MQEKTELWMQLEQAANEQDPTKLMALIEQLKALLEAKQQRLSNVSHCPRPEI